MRVAAADIGTNSTRLIVADVEHGAVNEVVRLLEITRLGQGVDAAGELEVAAMARVLECLARYAEVACTHGVERLLAVATSAVRDASNRDALLRRSPAQGLRHASSQASRRPRRPSRACFRGTRPPPERS